MEESFFINDDKQTPLLGSYGDDDYVLLEDDAHWRENSSWSTLHQHESPPTEESLMRSMLPQIPPSVEGVHSAECVLSDVYHYYWVRGLWRYVANEVGHFVLLTWLVLFCIFLGTCVNYAGLAAHGETAATSTTTSSLWQYVNFANFTSMNWFFVTALVLYAFYSSWRVIKFTRDLRRLLQVRRFYASHLHMDDFDLRTARWADVLERLTHVSEMDFAAFHTGTEVSRLHAAVKNNFLVAALITKKENFFKKFLELGQFDFVFRWRNTEVLMLTRGLQWNIMYCIVNYFFDTEMRLRNVAPTNENIIRLRKRIAVLAVLNIVLLPFLVVFVALYAVFRYGEQFYKNPGSIGVRQWALSARWYFRDYNELPHVLDERLRVGARHAKIYTSQFASNALEGAARTFAFIVGSIVVWLLLISFLNERALLTLDLTPGKALLWWITVLSSIWVVTRGVLQSQQVFYPQEALEVVYKLTRRLPHHFLQQPGTRNTLTQFKQLFPLQVWLLVLEFCGLIVTPYILLRRIYPKVPQIIDAIHDQMQYNDILQHHFVPFDLESGGPDAATLDESVTDYKEAEVLRSAALVPYLQHLDYVEI